jgi:hypothetical protein
MPWTLSVTLTGGPLVSVPARSHTVPVAKLGSIPGEAHAMLRFVIHDLEDIV